MGPSKGNPRCVHQKFAAWGLRCKCTSQAQIFHTCGHQQTECRSEPRMAPSRHSSHPHSSLQPRPAQQLHPSFLCAAVKNIVMTPLNHITVAYLYFTTRCACKHQVKLPILHQYKATRQAHRIIACTETGRRLSRQQHGAERIQGSSG